MSKTLTTPLRFTIIILICLVQFSYIFMLYSHDMDSFIYGTYEVIQSTETMINNILVSYRLTQSKPGWPSNDIFLMPIIHKKKQGIWRKLKTKSQNYDETFVKKAKILIYFYNFLYKIYVPDYK